MNIVEPLSTAGRAVAGAIARGERWSDARSAARGAGGPPAQPPARSEPEGATGVVTADSWALWLTKNSIR
jgi:hypothetical protein